MLDVAIVGAGAAGLGAAKAAASNGLSFRVLEAAHFVGGRARTDTLSLGVPYDLGCRVLYGGSNNPFVAYAKKTGARTGPPPQKTSYHNGIEFLDAKSTIAADAAYAEFESSLLAAHREASGVADLTAITDRSHDVVIDADNPYAAFLQMSQHPSLAEAAVVSIADPGITSLEIMGDEVLDGYGTLILNAAEDISVTTNCPVTAIDLSGKNVELETPKGRVEARSVVVTASTAVLAAERIAMRPNGWPDKKVAAIEAVPTASMCKIGFRLKSGALPPEFTTVDSGKIVGSYVYCAANGPENIFWQLGVGGGDLATAYVGGQFSRDLALAGEDTQTDWAMQMLCRLFGSSIQQSITGRCATPFDREPWIDGGNSYCRMGSGNQRPALAEPIDDRVYFAGEAYSLEYPGVAHGAWLSGQAAIEQIITNKRQK